MAFKLGVVNRPDAGPKTDILDKKGRLVDGGISLSGTPTPAAPRPIANGAVEADKLPSSQANGVSEAVAVKPRFSFKPQASVGTGSLPVRPSVQQRAVETQAGSNAVSDLPGTGTVVSPGGNAGNAAYGNVTTGGVLGAGNVPAQQPGPLGSELATSALDPAAQFQHPTQPLVMQAGTEEQLRADLEFLKNNFEHKDLLTSAIRRVLADLSANPMFRELLMPEDGQLLVRAVRQSYGAVQVEKKKTQRKSSKKSDIPVGMDDIANMLITV